MAMTTAAQESAIGLSALPDSAGQANFLGALRSEFTKIRSLRSTYWTLVALIVLSVGIGALFSFGHVQNVQQMQGTPAYASAAADAHRNAVATSLFGLLIGQLVIVVLGALTITSEYSTGMIRTSLSVLPKRNTFFAAKATVFTAVALVVGLVTSFASFFVGQAILSTQHVNASLGQPGALRAVIGGGLFLAACGLLSYGIGALLRHTAGAITASIGLLFVAFILSGFLPGNWAVHVDKWIPFNAGAAIWEQLSAQNMFAPWTGFAVFCGYVAIAMAAGLLLFRKRNA
jgi:ABC-2 type transport system permease protein